MEVYAADTQVERINHLNETTVNVSVMVNGNRVIAFSDLFRFKILIKIGDDFFLQFEVIF